MKHTINTRKVSFEIEPVLDLEIEPLDVSDWSPANLKETEKLTKKLEKLLT
jgi:hypothetical protein